MGSNHFMRLCVKTGHRVDVGIDKTIGTKSDYLASITPEAVFFEPDALITDRDTATQTNNYRSIFAAAVTIHFFIDH
ncbi:MAG: hypothetical protein CVT63_03765 [Candidatus Anoxymicrobium japonicum]|uniref:Uncharacterized protein n=1 Tax=Candidatus Anoxymicrobium japonicum TaxID=2013648 RepID=A0A2N3G6C4_9ACTN|nr:MAG: hypothetical protein CVT63_03765 [Candidatus Anoxymicrobium japonicum]